LNEREVELMKEMDQVKVVASKYYEKEIMIGKLPEGD
jgi:hypothetical protein